MSSSFDVATTEEMQMQAGTQQSALNVSSGVAGRRESDGTEKVVNLQPLRKKLKHLVALKDSLDAARDGYNAGVKAVAEETGLMSAVINKLIKARGDDKVDDEARKANQLSMVFAEIGGEAHPERQPTFSDSLSTGAAQGKGPKGNGKHKADAAPAPIGDGPAPAADVFANTDLGAGKNGNGAAAESSGAAEPLPPGITQRTVDGLNEVERDIAARGERETSTRKSAARTEH